MRHAAPTRPFARANAASPPRTHPATHSSQAPRRLDRRSRQRTHNVPTPDRAPGPPRITCRPRSRYRSTQAPALRPAPPGLPHRGNATRRVGSAVAPPGPCRTPRRRRRASGPGEAQPRQARRGPDTPQRPPSTLASLARNRFPRIRRRPTVPAHTIPPVRSPLDTPLAARIICRPAPAATAPTPATSDDADPPARTDGPG